MSDPFEPGALTEEQRLQLLVNSVRDYAIYMLDTKGRITTWNPGARRFKGYAAEEVIGRHFSCFFTQADKDAGLPERILSIAAAEGRYETEGRRVRKDGSEFWVHAVIDAIYGDDGTLLGFAKITRDITDRHEAETALFHTEQQFRMLVQGVHDYAIYMLDVDGRITNWNAGAELIKGYTADEIVGQHFSRFYTPEDREAGEPARALQTAAREGRYQREAERVRKDGTRFWADVVIDPIRNETGEIIGFAKITRDVTEKRRAQEELEEARTALFQSQKLQALGELTGGIAHDFNNLMTVIRGSAELLKKPGIPRERRDRYVEAIIDTAEKATTLTSRLLAFGRRQALRPHALDLAVRLDALGDVLSRTLGSPIEIVLDIAPDIHPIEADATELENALLNAAFNARDAMPRGGRLTIRARNAPDGESVCLSISDTGEGIPADLLDRVFEPFFTTKPQGKGTGLGLSQIHGFAAQTGGRATIESEAGKGTTVTLTLPRTWREPEAVQPNEPAIIDWHNLHVLLVEDNDRVRQFARTLLEELHAEVTEVSSAEKAEAALQDQSFDLVFSDIIMPGRSGLDLARRLRKLWPGQAILLATGYSREVTDGEAAGFPILQKPYGAESLTAAISQALAAAHH